MVVGAGCEDARCHASVPLHFVAPGGRASATRFEVNCATPVEYPYVSLRLREKDKQHEFILVGHLQVLRMRWTSAERLEIDYRNRTREIVRERLFDDDAVISVSLFRLSANGAAPGWDHHRSFEAGVRPVHRTLRVPHRKGECTMP